MSLMSICKQPLFASLLWWFSCITFALWRVLCASLFLIPLLRSCFNGILVTGPSFPSSSTRRVYFSSSSPWRRTQWVVSEDSFSNTSDWRADMTMDGLQWALGWLLWTTCVILMNHGNTYLVRERREKADEKPTQCFGRGRGEGVAHLTQGCS